MSEWIGWIATGVFTASYFCRRPALLRTVQMAGASIWVAYGIVTSAAPVVAANLLVLSAALVTARRRPDPELGSSIESNAGAG